MKTNGQHHENGYCKPTTINLISTTKNHTQVNELRSRGIVHSITDSGIARLLFTDDFTFLQGVLLNSYEESFSISGILKKEINKKDLVDDILHLLSPSSSNTSPKSVNRLMTITIVDAEAGQKFSIENVNILITVKHENGSVIGGPQLSVQINHPAIKFFTEDVFIGNRAEVEVQKYLGPACFFRSSSRSVLTHSEERNTNSLHIGTMSINVVTCERTLPAMRRVSVCDSCATNIIEQTNDFLV